MSTSGEERPWKQENLVFSSNNCDCSGLCTYTLPSPRRETKRKRNTHRSRFDSFYTLILFIYVGVVYHDWGICWFSWCCSCCLVQRNYNRYKYIRDHDKGKDTDEGDLNGKCGLMCCVQTFTTGWAHMILPVRFPPFPVISFK